ncbi:molecular chaperone DnaK [Platysternon megacephalum]|uniref:N-acetylglucosamine-6-phosphate deacetylase n=1 Tax=Platysternon megacephalum TaxID=55544 RepID=A0A4D9DII8_9SAUR|nr:molecular chaperone DnaK [Platysternon megacephalum]
MANQSSSLLIRNGRLFTLKGWTEADIAIVDGTVVGVGKELTVAPSTRSIDAAGQYIVPRLIDLQVNGAGGMMFSLNRSTVEFRAALETLGAQGVQGILVTILSASIEEMQDAIRIAVEVAESVQQGACAILGIHIEGPFISPEKRGGHAGGHLRSPNVEDMSKLLDAGSGWVKMVTLAPELPASLEVIALCQSKGIHVSAGHTMATCEETERAVRAGLSGATHLYNAMPPLSARDPGVAGFALAATGFKVGIIGDLLHVDPHLLRVAVLCKASSDIYLVTDAVAPLGADGVEFDLYGTRVSVRDGGCYTETGVLAGTATPLLGMIQKLVTSGVCSPHQAIEMATTSPARIVGSLDLVTIREGLRPRLMLLSEQLDLVELL